MSHCQCLLFLPTVSIMANCDDPYGRVCPTYIIGFIVFNARCSWRRAFMCNSISINRTCHWQCKLMPNIAVRSQPSYPLFNSGSGSFQLPLSSTILNGHIQHCGISAQYNGLYGTRVISSLNESETLFFLVICK